jgi:hypothetical protein
MATRTRARRRWRTLSWTAFPLLAAFAIGCGGDSELSRADFIEEADRVCERSSGEFARIQRTGPSTAQQAEEQTQELIDVSEQALDELREIEPPSDLSGGYERYLAARERAIGYLEQGRDAAADADQRAYAAAKRRAARGAAERYQRARDVGLIACARPPVTLGND